MADHHTVVENGYTFSEHNISTKDNQQSNNGSVQNMQHTSCNIKDNLNSDATEMDKMLQNCDEMIHTQETVLEKEDVPADNPSVTVEVDSFKPLNYKISETPPVHLLILFALQQALLNVGAPLGVAIVVAEVTCAQNDDVIKAQILSASMFMCGLSTFAMTTFGVRLPIFQGPTSMYLIPLIAMSATSEFQCPNVIQERNSVDNSTLLFAEIGNGTLVPARDIILQMLSRLSGSLILVGALHFLIGFTGLVGIIISYIGPITIVPTIVLIGLHFYKVVASFVEPSWLIASITCLSNLILSLFLSNKLTPLPCWSPSKGFYIFWYPFHQLFSVLISLIIGWFFSGVFTAAGYFTDDENSRQYLARTDAKGNLIAEAPWFDMPYPGKFGEYTFSTAAFLSFLVATFLSVLDSIGDYGACARTAHVVQPPRFAFNRGIAVEGIASLIAGSMGCCHATVTYGSNIGCIGITGVASRCVFQLCGIMFMIAAVLGKVGAFLITIPLPVIGGVSLVMMGLFIGMVISYLEAINLRSTRNLAIIGIALMLGMTLPYWIGENPDGVKSGSEQLNQLITILLSNPSFVGGLFACLMDNLVPGTMKERGLLEQIKELDGDSEVDISKPKDQFEEGREVYRLPYIPEALRQSKLARVFPIFDRLGS